MSKHALATDLAQVNVPEIQLTQARHKLPGLWQSQTALPLRGQYHHDPVLICSLQESRITVVDKCLGNRLGTSQRSRDSVDPSTSQTAWPVAVSDGTSSKRSVSS